MNKSLAIMASIVLLTTGCDSAPVVDESGISAGTRATLINSNHTVCIDGRLYFVSYQTGVPIINSPVADSNDSRATKKCENGIRLSEIHTIK